MRQVTLAAAAVLAAAFVILPSASAIVCTADICSRIRCQNDMTVESCAAEGLTYVEDGGFCGCCPACIKILKTGQHCPTFVERGAPPTEKCEDGLVCKKGRCVESKPSKGKPKPSTRGY